MAVNIPPVEILLKAVDQIGPVLDQLQRKLELLEKQASESNKAIGQGQEQNARKTNLLQDGIGALAFAFNQVTAAVRTFQAVGTQVFDQFIAQNVQLQSQIRGVSATLASLNNVSVGDKPITDAVQAIKTVTPLVQEQIDQLRKDSLNLVGVTSTELVSRFQVVAQNASALKLSLSQAEQVTVKLSAAATTLGLDSQQTAAYVDQIARGQIDSQNTLAKSLQLNQEQLKVLVSQGKLYDFIDNRTKALVAGQALAATSFEGVTSNIQEVVDLVTQAAGAPLLDELVKVLNEFYKILKDNQPQLEAFGKAIAEDVVRAAQAIEKNLGPVFQNLFQIIATNGATIQNLFTLITQGIEIASAALGPLLKTTTDVTVKLSEAFNVLSQILNIRSVKNVNEELENYSKTSQQLTDRSVALGAELKRLTAIQANGGKLTDEQAKRLKTLQSATGNVTSQIQEQIGALQQIPPVNAEIQKQRDAQIAQLKKLEAALASTNGGIKLEGKQVDDLGETYKYLGSQADAALEKVANGGKGITRDQFNQQTQALQQYSQQLFESGQITKDEYQRRLELIVNSNKTEIADRQKAQQAIRQLNEQASNLEVETLKSKEAEIQGLQQDGVLSEVEAAKQITAVREEEASKRLEVTRQAILKELEFTKGADSPRLQQLKNQEKQITAELTKTKVDGRKQIAEAEAKEINAQQAQIKAQAEAGKLNEVEAEKQITALKIKEIETRLAAAVAGSSEEKKLQADLLSAQVQGRKAIAEAQVKQIQLGEEQTKAAIADGQIGELEGEQKLTEAKKQEYQKRIAAAAKGTLEQKKLIAELQQFEDDAENKLSALKLKRFEQDQQRALDVAVAAEKERQIQQQALINQGLLREEEANTARLEAQKKTTAEELREAQQKVEFLRKLPRPDGEKEIRERKELEINARKAVFDATIKLLDQQRQLQKSILDDLSRELKKQTDAANNATREQTLGLEKQLLVSDAYTKTLKAQSDLLQARQSLSNSFVDLATSELDILQKGATSEKEKQDIAQATALIKYQALKAQNESERESLNLQLQQEATAIRRQKIENDIAKTKNQADVLSKQAALVRAEADLKAGKITKEERDAAALELRATQQQGVALQVQDQQIKQQESLFSQTAQARVQQQQNKAFQSEQSAVFGLLDAGKDNPQVAQVRDQFLRNLTQSLGLGQNLSGLGTQLQTLLPQVVSSAVPGVSNGGVNALALASGALPVAPLGVVPGVSVAAAEQAAQQQQPLLNLSGKIETLQQTLVDALKPTPVVDAVKNLGSEIRTLAGTPRALTVVSQEKQSISDVLQAQSRSLAVAAGL